VKANKAFAEKHRFGFPLLCDSDHSMAVAYGAAASTDARSPRRVTYIIDAEGRIEYAGAVSLFGIKSHVKTAIARLQETDP